MNQLVSDIYYIKIGIQNMDFPLTFPFKQVFFNIEEYAGKQSLWEKSFNFCFSKFTIEKHIPLNNVTAYCHDYLDFFYTYQTFILS